MSERSILVVGGSHGIGRSIVQRFVDAGDRVTVVSRTLGDLDSLATRVTHISADVTSDEIASNSLPETIDAMAYCPGSINLGQLRSTKPDAIRSDFELNVMGAVQCFQAALPALQKSQQASAVFFSTVAVAQGIPMHTSVAASKGALEALTRTWAAELAPKVRVNAVAPALTDTPLSQRLLANEARREAMAAKYPMGRLGVADDIAAAAAYLMGSESSWITGQIFHVDGGMSSIQ